MMSSLASHMRGRGAAQKDRPGAPGEADFFTTIYQAPDIGVALQGVGWTAAGWASVLACTRSVMFAQPNQNRKDVLGVMRGEITFFGTT